MARKNLLTETIEFLNRYDHKPMDVYFVTDGFYSATWNDFSDAARKIDYDSGYGCVKIFHNLKLVGKDWWIERHEYDGSEWWEYKTMPKTGLFNPAKVRYLEKDWD